MTQKNYIEFSQTDLPIVNTFDSDVLLRDYFYQNNDGGAPVLTGGELKYAISSPDTNTYDSRIRYGAKIYGSFDVQIDYRFVAGSNNATYQRNFNLYFDFYSSDDTYVGRGILYRREQDGAANRLQAHVWDAVFSTIFSLAVVPTSDVDDNTIRITYNKFTDIMAFYYWDAGWTEIISGVVGLGLDYVIPVLSSSVVDSSFDGYFDNFTINSADDVKWVYKYTDPFEGGATIPPYTGDTFDEDTGSSTGLDEVKWNPWGTQGLTPFWTDEFGPGYCKMHTNNDGAGAYGTTYLDSKYEFTGDFEFSFLMRWGSGQSIQHGLWLYAYDASGNNSGMYIQLSDVNNMYVETLNGGFVNQGALVGTVGSMFTNYTTVTMKRVGRDLTITVSNAGGTSTKTVTDAISVGEATDPWRVRVSLSNWFTQDTNYRETYYRVDDYDIISGETNLPTGAISPIENWWSERIGTNEINNDALTQFIDGESQVNNIISDFALSGDIDFQFNFSFDGQLPQYISGANCVIKDTSEIEYFMMRREYDGVDQKYRSLYWNGSIWVDAGEVNSSDTTGKFRFRRTGNAATGEYWDGSSWQVIGSHTFASSPDLTVRLGNDSWNPFVGSVTQSITDFVINSCDNIIWPGGTLKRFIPNTLPWVERFDAPLDPAYWGVGGTFGTGPAPTLAGGLLTFDQTGTYYKFGTSFTITGDFDIQVDMRMVSYDTVNNFKVMLLCEDLSAPFGSPQILRTYQAGSDTTRTQIWNGTSFEQVDNHGVYDTATFRIVRIGNTFNYYLNAAFVDTDTFVMGATVRPVMQVESNTSNPHVVATWDNFIINSADTVNWTSEGSWIPEAINRFVLIDDVAPWTDDFVGTDGDVPDTRFWFSIGQTTIQNDQVELFYPSSGTRPQFRSVFSFVGDFDIETNISSHGLQGIGGTEQDINFRMTTPLGDNVNLQINNASGVLQVSATSTLSGDGNNLATWTANSDVAFKVTRVSGLCRLYYKTIASGTWIAVPDYSWVFTTEVILQVDFWYGSNPEIEWTGLIDSVTINSGTINWNGAGNWNDSILKLFTELTASDTPITDNFNTINTDQWTKINTNGVDRTVTENGSSLRFTSTTPQSPNPGIRSVFHLQGDFEVECNSLGGTYLDTINRRFIFQAQDVITGIYAYIRHGIDGVGGRGFVYRATHYLDHQPIADVSDLVKYRIVRVGATITVYAQEVGGTEYSHTFTGDDTYPNDCRIELRFRVDQPPDCYIDVDNFTIISADGIDWLGVPPNSFKYVGNV
jgi:hypothetical protein